MIKKTFDIIVIGGGHAGIEAACSAARMGADVALVTSDSSKIGVMSCNPAIGGIGKGHIVRYIDAMGGLMGYAADKASIQYKVLNIVKSSRKMSGRQKAHKRILMKSKSYSNIKFF